MRSLRCAGPRRALRPPGHQRLVVRGADRRATPEEKTMTEQTAPGTQPVLVGVDGSESALDAVRWGALEARRRRTALRLITSFAYGPDNVIAMPALGDQVRDELVAGARHRLAAAVGVAEQTGPGLEVTADVL